MPNNFRPFKLFHTQGGSGHWTVNHTSFPMFYKHDLSFVCLKNYVDYYKLLISWFSSSSVQTFLSIILSIYNTHQIF